LSRVVRGCRRLFHVGVEFIRLRFSEGCSHTVTADDISWISSTLTAGQTFSHKFDKPGKYPYYCAFHGAKGGHNMAGVVNIAR
jgi:plastocyanin